MNKLIHGDCLEEMQKLIDDGVKVDAVICDPPYGTTACKWDSIIPLESMWEKLNCICNRNSAMVMFGMEPFSTNLRYSNLSNYNMIGSGENQRLVIFHTLQICPLKFWRIS